ncbi:phosphopantetheine-binding protein [Streptomyces sp. NPDC058326]|uniref:phosphopantetheine-binding protein n=1 Tax=Streptomyces sp. NPDC058326 TaxID=3346447 RepID=UPI0036ED7367
MKDDLGLGAVRGRLAEIWCEALAVDHVEDGTDFFAVGGRSLLAVQVTARAADVFGVEVRSSDLAVDASFGAMVERVTKALPSTTGSARAA